MSDQIGNPQGWAALDRSAQIRQSAIAVLAAARLPCGLNVYDTPLDPYQIANLPAIGVSSAETREPFGLAGTAPQVLVRFTLRVQYVFAAAQDADIVTGLDAAKRAILDTLLEDPVLTSAPLLFPIGSIHTKPAQGLNGQQILGDMTVEIECSWRETYIVRATSPLNQGGGTTGLPDTQRQVIAPLLAFRIATLASHTAQIQAGGANAGNGTLAASPGASVQAGSYQIVFTGPTSFTLTSPSTNALGTGTVGAPLATAEITVTLTAGTTPFAAGDVFAAAFDLVIASDTVSG